MCERGLFAALTGEDDTTVAQVPTSCTKIGLLPIAIMTKILLKAGQGKLTLGIIKLAKQGDKKVVSKMFCNAFRRSRSSCLLKCQVENFVSVFQTSVLGPWGNEGVLRKGVRFGTRLVSFDVHARLLRAFAGLVPHANATCTLFTC